MATTVCWASDTGPDAVVIVDWATGLGSPATSSVPSPRALAVTPSAVCSSDDQFGVPLLVDVDVAADADAGATASAPTPTMGSRAASSGPVYLFISFPSPGGAPRATDLLFVRSAVGAVPFPPGARENPVLTAVNE